MCTQSTSGYWDGCIERFEDLSNITYNGPDSDTLTQVLQLLHFKILFYTTHSMRIWSQKCPLEYIYHIQRKINKDKHKLRFLSVNVVFLNFFSFSFSSVTCLYMVEIFGTQDSKTNNTVYWLNPRPRDDDDTFSAFPHLHCKHWRG